MASSLAKGIFLFVIILFFVIRGFDPSFAMIDNFEDHEEKKPSRIHTTLPRDILVYAFTFLPSYDQAKSREVCSSWKTFIDDENNPQLNSLGKFILGKTSADFIQTQNHLFNTQNAPLLMRAVIEENDPLSFAILRPQLLKALESSQESKDLLTQIVLETPFDVENFLELIKDFENHSKLKKHLVVRSLLAGDVLEDPTIKQTFTTSPESLKSSQEDLYFMLNFESILQSYFRELLFTSEDTPNKKKILQMHILHAKQPFWFAYLSSRSVWFDHNYFLTTLSSEACKEVNLDQLERFVMIPPSFRMVTKDLQMYPLIRIYDMIDYEERGISFLSSIKDKYLRQNGLADFYRERRMYKEASDIYCALLKEAADISSKYDLIEGYYESLLRAPYDKEKYTHAKQTLDEILDYAHNDDSFMRSEVVGPDSIDGFVEMLKHELLKFRAFFRFYEDKGEDGRELVKLFKDEYEDEDEDEEVEEIELSALTRALRYRGWQTLDKEVQSSFLTIIKKGLNELYKEKKKYKKKIQSRSISTLRWYKEDFLPNIDLWKEILSADTKAMTKFSNFCFFLKNLMESELRIEK